MKDENINAGVPLQVMQKNSEEGGMRKQGDVKQRRSSGPLITVVTVVYNGAETIGNAIDSVLDQTYDNIEYIIVDGGSDDGTLDVIKRYDSRLDYWVSEPDEGVYDAMNKSVSLSNGDYVLFLGCDDILLDVLHEVTDSFDMSNTSYYGDVIMRSDNQLYDGVFESAKFVQKNIPHQAIFYSRGVFDKYQYDLKYIALADYDLNIKLYSDSDFGFKYIPRAIALYNDEYGLSTTTIDHVFIRDKPMMVFKHFSIIQFFRYLYVRKVLKQCW